MSRFDDRYRQGDRLMKGFIIVFLFALLIPVQSFAASGTKLLKYAPLNSKVVFGLDIAKIKKTPLFKKGMQYLRSSTKKGSTLDLALNNSILNIEKDINTVLVASKAPKGMNPNNIKPVDSVIIIEGNFDLSKIKEATKNHNAGMTVVKTEKGIEILILKKAQIALVDSKTVIIASPKTAKVAWETLSGAKKSVESVNSMKKLLKITNLTQGLWAVAAIASARTPKLKGTSISASLSSGLSMLMKTVMTKKEDAVEAKKDIEKMVKSQGAVIRAFGAGELIDNLKVSIERKKIVRMKTKISNKAFLALFSQLEAFAKSQIKAHKGKKPKAIPKRKASGADSDFN